METTIGIGAYARNTTRSSLTLVDILTRFAKAIISVRACTFETAMGIDARAHTTLGHTTAMGTTFVFIYYTLEVIVSIAVLDVGIISFSIGQRMISLTDFIILH
jgi:hypothetical protein